MQNRSLFGTVFDDKFFPESFRAKSESYIQNTREDNSLHFHSCLEIGICVSGSGVEFIGDKIYPFHSNSISFIQKNCVHDSHIVPSDPADPPSEWRFVFADLDALSIAVNFPGSFILSDAELVSLFHQMYGELDRKQEDYQAVFLLLLRAFLAKLRRILPQSSFCKEQMPDQIVYAINYIAQNYGRDVTIAQLAKSSNMSVSYFRKRFRESLGCCPLEYLNNARLSIAEHLLRTTKLSVLSVSEDVGFRSLSSFNRLFKRVYGVSPRQIREHRSF